MPHNLQHPTVYTCPLTLGKIKHKPDTMYSEGLRPWGASKGKELLQSQQWLPDDHDLGPKFSKHLRENFCIFSDTNSFLLNST